MERKGRLDGAVTCRAARASAANLAPCRLPLRPEPIIFPVDPVPLTSSSEASFEQIVIADRRAVHITHGDDS